MCVFLLSFFETQIWRLRKLKTFHSQKTVEIVESQDKQQSTNPMLAKSVVELNQTMSHMAMMLGDLLQKSQDKGEPVQQTEVEQIQAKNDEAKNAKNLAQKRLPHPQIPALLLKVTAMMIVATIAENHVKLVTKRPTVIKTK